MTGSKFDRWSEDLGSMLTVEFPRDWASQVQLSCILQQQTLMQQPELASVQAMKGTAQQTGNAKGLAMLALSPCKEPYISSTH